MTAKELLLERVADWTEAQAAAALRVVEAQNELSTFFDAEAKLTDAEHDARDDRWARAGARDMIRDERW